MLQSNVPELMLITRIQIRFAIANMFEEKEAKVLGYYYTYLNHELLKMDQSSTALSVKRL